MFFILEGDHIHLLLEQLMPLKSLPSSEELMVMSAGVMLPTTWMKDLSALSYIGAFGVLSSFGLTGVVLYEFFHHGLKVCDSSASLKPEVTFCNMVPQFYLASGHWPSVRNY